jgi:hypothetical protein
MGTTKEREKIEDKGPVVLGIKQHQASPAVYVRHVMQPEKVSGMRLPVSPLRIIVDREPPNEPLRANPGLPADFCTALVLSLYQGLEQETGDTDGVVFLSMSNYILLQFDLPGY